MKKELEMEEMTMVNGGEEGLVLQPYTDPIFIKYVKRVQENKEKETKEDDKPFPPQLWV